MLQFDTVQPSNTEAASPYALPSSSPTGWDFELALEVESSNLAGQNLPADPDHQEETSSDAPASAFLLQFILLASPVPEPAKETPLVSQEDFLRTTAPAAAEQTSVQSAALETTPGQFPALPAQAESGRQLPEVALPKFENAGAAMPSQPEAMTSLSRAAASGADVTTGNPQPEAMTLPSLPPVLEADLSGRRQQPEADLSSSRQQLESITPRSVATERAADIERSTPQSTTQPPVAAEQYRSEPATAAIPKTETNVLDPLAPRNDATRTTRHQGRPSSQELNAPAPTGDVTLHSGTFETSSNDTNSEQRDRTKHSEAEPAPSAETPAAHFRFSEQQALGPEPTPEPALSAIRLQTASSPAATVALPAETAAGEPGSRMWRSEEKASVLSQLVEKAQLMVKDKSSEIVVSLKPEFLGRITVRARLVDHALVTTIVTESHSVKALLQSDLPALQHVLQEAGVNAAKVIVTRESDMNFAGSSSGDSHSYKEQSSSFSHQQHSPPSRRPDDLPYATAFDQTDPQPELAGVVPVLDSRYVSRSIHLIA